MHDILQNCMQAEKLHGRVTPNTRFFLTLIVGVGGQIFNINLYRSKLGLGDPNFQGKLNL